MLREGADTMRRHLRIYIAVFVALLVLTVLTVAASTLTAGVAASIVIALIIATVKGSLVGSFFMHLAWEKPAIYALLLVAGAFLVTMMGLFIWGLNSPLAGTGAPPMEPVVAHELATEGH